MTDQKIDIADLVKPKFKPGEQVYVVQKDSHGVEFIRRVLIEEVRFTVTFKRNQDRPFRKTSLMYELLNYGQTSEDRLYANLEDIARNEK